VRKTGSPNGRALWERRLDARTFCGRCGSPLTYRHTSYEGKKIDVTTVSLDAPEAFPPQGHVWTSHKLKWLKLADGLPCFDEGVPS
jgi:hypothetical protein